MAIFDNMPSRDEILARLNAQGTQAKAAKSYGITGFAFESWLRANKINRGDYKSRVSGRKSQCPSRKVLVAALEQFKTTKAVSVHFGVHRETILNWFTKHGIQCPTRARLEKCDIPVLRQLEGHMSAQEAANKFDVTRKTVENAWSKKTWAWVKDVSYLDQVAF
jgi:hypothetical protein